MQVVPLQGVLGLVQPQVDRELLDVVRGLVLRCKLEAHLGRRGDLVPDPPLRPRGPHKVDISEEVLYDPEPVPAEPQALFRKHEGHVEHVPDRRAVVTLVRNPRRDVGHQTLLLEHGQQAPLSLVADQVGDVVVRLALIVPVEARELEQHVKLVPLPSHREGVDPSALVRLSLAGEGHGRAKAAGHRGEELPDPPLQRGQVLRAQDDKGHPLRRVGRLVVLQQEVSGNVALLRGLLDQGPKVSPGELSEHVALRRGVAPELAQPRRVVLQGLNELGLHGLHFPVHRVFLAQRGVKEPREPHQRAPQALGLHVKVVVRAFCVRIRVGHPAVLAQVRVVLVLVGKVLRPHEQHVLQKVTHSRDLLVV
mmetsp:Transcript_94/g.394  ORF Transcript_94/g.394 Transcript_94/m.394 type:complete len:365 (+) Transcript_94:4803-5897(+)